jgi:hypothetical protein
LRKLIALLFAVALLAATSFTTAAFANNGRDSNGNPGPLDNCTGLYQGNDSQFSQGEGWHAADNCEQ